MHSLPQIAVLMCHAPIVIPSIAGSRAETCKRSTKAMQEAASAVVQSGAAAVLLVSPHTPRARIGFTAFRGEMVGGSFRQFGFPSVQVRFRSDPALVDALSHEMAQAGLAMTFLTERELDHGALVPLWFLQEAGFSGTVVVTGIPAVPVVEQLKLFGSIACGVLGESGRPWGLIASGDMSHRLLPGAPAGYHPEARTFDETVVTALDKGEIGPTLKVCANLRTTAAEDVVDSLAVAAGAIGDHMQGGRVLSYEGPFGVGYLNAILYQPNQPAEGSS